MSSEGGPSYTITGVSNAKINFDKSNKKLIYFASPQLVKVDLDGSNNEVLVSEGDIYRFALDMEAESLYYLQLFTRNIWAMNVTDGSTKLLYPESGKTRIADLDIDSRNK